MAFSFGGAPAASSGGFSFGGASAAASSGGFSFGGGAAPASSGGFGFGASAAPASGGGFSFGGAAAPASSGGFGFGAASTPATSGGFGFGAASTPGATTSLFGAASSAAFGGFGASATPASSGGAFSFGGGAAASTGALTTFGAAAPAASPFGGFGAPAAAAQQQQQQQAGAGALTYASKFDDLPPQAKQAFQQLQQQISQYESDRVAVSQMPHLQEAPGGGRVRRRGSSPLAASFLLSDVGADATALQSELRGALGSMRAESDELANYRERAVMLLKQADYLVRTFQRTKLWRDAPTQFKGQVMPTAMQELLSQPVTLPSFVLEESVAGFASKIGEFKKTVAELESWLAAHGGAARGGGGGGLELLGAEGLDASLALPTVVGNLHDYFTHVAAKLERVHRELQTVKAAYRAALRGRGVHTDPFESAAKAAARSDKARAAPPPLLPAPAESAVAAAAAAAAAGGGAGGFGQGASGYNSFGSPFPGATPGGFGTPQGGAALGRTSSKTSGGRSKSRR